jgi:hypothetical protein
MRVISTIVVLAAAMAGCAQTTAPAPSATYPSASYPSASPPPVYYYSSRAQCEAAGGTWSNRTGCVIVTPNSLPPASTRTGPSGTPGELPPGMTH